MKKAVREINTERERDELFMDLLGCLWRYNDAEKKAIAEEAECSWTTLYAWCSGRTMTPRIDTLTRVARALGFRIVLERDVKLPQPHRGLRRVK